MKILHLDSNHDILEEKLSASGFDNHHDYTSRKSDIEKVISNYDGLVVRSRFPIDQEFLSKATHLKCIGRVGAGLENIDLEAAQELGIACFNAPEGNRNAVGEHALGMLLSLFNKLNKADSEVRQGIWDREGNRGLELDGKTVGIIGYGNMGKAFAKKLRGFDCTVLCHDIKKNVGDENATQVSLEELQTKADVLSLHTPQTPDTIAMVNESFIAAFKKPFYLINTARGSAVVTADLVAAMQSGKVLGAGLDVLEYEKSSFESLFRESDMPEALKKLMQMDNVILSPHVGGWTVESKYKLAEVIADKMIKHLKS
ncbi:D-3-phosphoglycerate dehydrogenase [Nonlabens sp. Hel1_33_55]|uniref:2-hydroxyacid dehydrogenase n=1 Tax=Nonlabens sp. Hel1_33_55 TaxID=1336802 RepID=UPI000875E54E|nr:2-hydroxyacid dehydrogenase [Nonlabens sp. Hel1_33_55]SCY26492.1 D-3-phosphoglycerate dehydrogenase [Nonlabens sp. Hel1_33_55]